MLANQITADTDPPSAPAHTPLGLEAIVLGAVGVYFVLTSTRDVAELIYAIARHPAWDERSRFASALEGRQEELAGAFVQLIAGTALFLRRSQIASAWSGRAVAAPDSSSEPPPA